MIIACRMRKSKFLSQPFTSLKSHFPPLFCTALLHFMVGWKKIIQLRISITFTVGINLNYVNSFLLLLSCCFCASDHCLVENMLWTKVRLLNRWSNIWLQNTLDKIKFMVIQCLQGVPVLRLQNNLTSSSLHHCAWLLVWEICSGFAWFVTKRGVVHYDQTCLLYYYCIFY